MKYLIKSGRLIINVEGTNNSLSNPEVLSEVIPLINKSISKIIIKNDYLIKEYDSSLLIGLKDFKTSNPIKEFLNGRSDLERTKIISSAKKVMKDGMSFFDVYNKLFIPKIKPSFVKSDVFRFPRTFKKVNNYFILNSKINILSNGTKFFYEVLPVEFSIDFDSIKLISKTLKEIETKELDLNDFKREVIKLIDNKKLSSNIKSIIKRHTIGFGLLDIVFSDEQVQDIYVYSSDNHVYVNHNVFGECQTNIITSKDDIEAIATKIRVVSGRPFDDSFPVIDYELEDYNLRVCGVREPLTFNGIGYAFRKHRMIPWNSIDFIVNGMMSSEIAGLINFLVDGQCSILITGSRGSGKTSVLSALINEIPVNQRIIIIEDTPELPVNKLIFAGYKIQHLRIKPSSKNHGFSYELSAEEALRTALRLGESVLVIGEVRGEEAQALFEAMRVGAAGNVVLGTIHGSTVYDTFDRIVNDLKVPATSFKSTDIIISCANLRRGESLKTDRRITSITEVRKDWVSNPLIEGGFNELTVFDRKRNVLRLSPKIRDSFIIKKIADLKGLSVSECLRSIKLRGKAKELIIKLNVPKNPSDIVVYNNQITELLSKDPKNFLKNFKQFLINYKKGPL